MASSRSAITSGSAPHLTALRQLGEQAFSRAAGAPLVAGNAVRILKDAEENFTAWLAAIRGAQRSILFEHYIVADDCIGREFVAALSERARAGVRVRVIYDWFGALGNGGTRLWQPLREAGGMVRCFNPPQLESPFGWLTRDHRKLIAVDGTTAYVSGVCVSVKWLGDAARGTDAWRDTGVEICGPAVCDVEQAFAQVWAACGEPLPEAEWGVGDGGGSAPSGDISLRVIAAAPSVAGLYRLDQMIAAMATRTLWLADAYFVGVTTYVQALRAAALDGVDVRLLVPGASDLPLVSRVSRAGYRGLLEAGVRVFEWNGTMMHAKSAVADGRWARVGSSNLNVASWIGNYEIDVAIEDEGVAQAMQEMYERDLTNSTEIVLGPRYRVRTAAPGRQPNSGRRQARAVRAAAGALRLGHVVGAAIVNRRLLGPAEASIMLIVGLALLVLAGVGLMWPLAVAVPLTALAAWVAVSLLMRAGQLLRRRARERQQGETGPE